MAERVLVVDDEEGIRTFIQAVLEGEGLHVTTASNGRVAVELLEKRSYHLLITDLRMPELDGLELVRHVRARIPEMEVLVLTAHGTVDSAVEALKLGAVDYLQKPLSGPPELRLLVANALERRRLREERQRAVDAATTPAFVAEDNASRRVVDELTKVAPTNATVLLLGESGTGKEVAARFVHQASTRAQGPFVAVNCAAVSPQLVESELFGHEKGAFTGATERRRGRFELADNGTLFLDEVAELPAALQAKLLRVLEEHSFERVGGSRTIDVDVRVVAATNRILEEEIAAGRFRQDLYHRLAVFPVQLPPLRQRPGDLLPIARYLLSQLAPKLGKAQLSLTAAAERVLQAYDWPGNVRELKNALERAAILSDSSSIDSAQLSLHAIAQVPTGALQGTLKDIEREAIKQALVSSNGHRKQAAEHLGIGVRTLYDKIREYSLE